MTNTLRVVLAFGILLYFCVVVKLLKEKKLALKYSLLWLVMGMVMAVLVSFPQMLRFLSNLIGIVDSMNGLFSFAIAFILMLLLSITAIVSKQSDRIKNLVQDNALLERRIRELEKKLEENKM